MDRTERSLSAPAVLLASGGLDSTVLAYWLASRGTDVRVAFLDYGQHCVETEFRTLQEVIPTTFRSTIQRINVSSVFRSSGSRLIQQADLWSDPLVSEDLNLPYRNMFLLSTGVAYAASVGAASVYAAFINSNHAREVDATVAFLDAMDGLVAESGSVHLEMPFREMSKAEVARIGISLGAPVARTYSCQAHSEVHCGACPNCVDRTAALRELADTGISG
jgi:7-cyano-7-deazaguanine synthase